MTLFGRASSILVLGTTSGDPESPAPTGKRIGKMKVVSKGTAFFFCPLRWLKYTCLNHYSSFRRIVVSWDGPEVEKSEMERLDTVVLYHRIILL